MPKFLNSLQIVCVLSAIANALWCFLRPDYISFLYSLYSPEMRTGQDSKLFVERRTKVSKAKPDKGKGAALSSWFIGDPNRAEAAGRGGG
jgi:hypothetical protein